MSYLTATMRSVAFWKGGNRWIAEVAEPLSYRF